MRAQLSCLEPGTLFDRMFPMKRPSLSRRMQSSPSPAPASAERSVENEKMEHTDTGRLMGHQAIGTTEAVGADVCTIKAGDLVVMPFAFSDGTCVFCRAGFTPRASMEGSSAPLRSPEHKLKRCVSLWQTAHSSSCRPVKMKR